MSPHALEMQTMLPLQCFQSRWHWHPKMSTLPQTIMEAEQGEKPVEDPRSLCSISMISSRSVTVTSNFLFLVVMPLFLGPSSDALVP